MTKNPCLKCDHHQAGGDKNAYCCKNCEDRIAYVLELAGHRSPEIDDSIQTAKKGGASVDVKQPEEPSFIQKSPAAEKVKTRKCYKCGKTKELNADNFNPHINGPDGFTKICKSCHALSVKKGHREQQEKKEKTQEEQTAIKLLGRSPFGYEGQSLNSDFIYINLSDHPDLQSIFMEICKKEMRPPTYQVLHLIQCACAQHKEVGDGKRSSIR